MTKNRGFKKKTAFHAWGAGRACCREKTSANKKAGRRPACLLFSAGKARF